MNEQYVKNRLRKLYEDLINSINDPEIKDILQHRSFITGGCIPSMLSDEFVNDFDIYFISEEDTDTIKRYYQSLLDNNNNQCNSTLYSPTLITENSVNLTNHIQLVLKFVGFPEEIVENFDWAHIKSYYSLSKGLILTNDIYKLLLEKQLIYTGSEYPLSTLLRLRKYLSKGWKIDTQNLVAIAMDIVFAFRDDTWVSDDIKLIDVEKMIEQLNGVDPLTIQKELKKRFGEKLDLKTMLSLMNSVQ